MKSPFPNKVIKIFESVRDIPYHAPEGGEDVNRGCWGKNMLLYNKLKKAGYKVRYRISDCYVEKQNFPDDMKALWPGGLMRHLFIEILLGGEWFTLDSTNDSGLPRFNDLRTQKECKVFGIQEKPYGPVEGEQIRKAFLRERKLFYEEHKAFYKRLNQLFEELRNKK